MRMRLILSVFACIGLSATVSANDPGTTVVLSEQVLGELMAIPAKQIPHKLLHEAQGVVIVPDVVKIGFVAAGRRGHGVVMVRDNDGEWSLPQFITLTGGSVGYQAGIQATDVVLVFRTRKGVEGLMRGKFTIGADASVTAGPVGREAAASTDAVLQSEVLSYARSRGLFVGVSLEGTALEIDHEAHLSFYGTPSGALPRHVPGAATDLRHFMAELTPRQTPALAAGTMPPSKASPRMIEILRRSLIRNSEQLQAILTPEWQRYLALPKELQEPGLYPQSRELDVVLQHFSRVNSSSNYEHLAHSTEFQLTYEQLREYAQAVVDTKAAMHLPPPPNDLRRD